MGESLFSQAHSYAMDLDEKLDKEYGFGLNVKDYQNVVDCLLYPQTRQGQKKFYDIFNKLSAIELIEKSKKVSRLVHALGSIKRNKR